MTVQENLREFLGDLEERNSESYRKKYSRLKELIFDLDASQLKLADDEEMYELLRYAVEAFFLTFDSFCELIYLKRFKKEYLLKKIFINKAKNIT